MIIIIIIIILIIIIIIIIVIVKFATEVLMEHFLIQVTLRFAHGLETAISQQQGTGFFYN